MRPLLITSLATVAIIFCACTSATNNIESKRVAIPFVGHGGIKDWRAVGEKAILIESRNNQWYRATFKRRCFHLNDSITRKVSFKADATGSFDRHSEVIVEGVSCQVRTLEEWINPDEMREQTGDGFVS